MDVVVAVIRLFVASMAFMATKELWLEGDLHTLVFFTNHANIAFLVVLVWGALGSLGLVRQPPAVLKGGIVLFLAITGLVSHFVLAPEDPDAPIVYLGLTSGQIEHQFTPVLAALDFLLLDRHRRLRWRAAAWWLAYLIVYLAFVLVRAELIAAPHYPYGFIDLGEHGWGGLAVNVLMYGGGFYVLGLLIVAIDKVLPARPLIGSAGERGPWVRRSEVSGRRRPRSVHK